MSDKSFWEENNFDKDQYPLKVEYVSDKDGGYLREEKNESRYIPVSKTGKILGRLFLRIKPPITYEYTCSSSPESTLYASAVLSDDQDKIRFFGTERDLEEIRVKIYPNPDAMQIQFLGSMASQYDDGDRTEEFLSLSLTFPQNQFDHLLRAWEQENIDFIQIEIKKNLIGLSGLYQRDCYSPLAEYKILTDKRMVKNWEEMPEDFTDFMHCKTFNNDNDSFSITMLKTKFDNEKENFYQEVDPYDNKKVISSINIIQLNKDIIKTIENKSYKITIYLFFIILLLLIRLIT